MYNAQRQYFKVKHSLNEEYTVDAQPKDGNKNTMTGLYIPFCLEL